MWQERYQRREDVWMFGIIKMKMDCNKIIIFTVQYFWRLLLSNLQLVSKAKCVIFTQMLWGWFMLLLPLTPSGCFRLGGPLWCRSWAGSRTQTVLSSSVCQWHISRGRIPRELSWLVAHEKCATPVLCQVLVLAPADTFNPYLNKQVFNWTLSTCPAELRT